MAFGISKTSLRTSTAPELHHVSPKPHDSFRSVQSIMGAMQRRQDAVSTFFRADSATSVGSPFPRIPAVSRSFPRFDKATVATAYQNFLAVPFLGNGTRSDAPSPIHLTVPGLGFAEPQLQETVGLFAASRERPLSEYADGKRLPRQGGQRLIRCAHPRARLAHVSRSARPAWRARLPVISGRSRWRR